ncbi:hypothetical protein IG195_20565 (plasmid) [Arthrobacter sp. TES]|uniref:hypothetical protein n=1 Tax=Paenarthrobacter ureafaciens TaxID=37931 RepID=UPI000395E805|nr:hypothetical protein [Paenarthrobacter ureafaciens]AOY74170.1 hypothetical protein ARZXY2_4671 [Arthrobacter sp. ZXY-2]QOI65762.1 hypothetical protein IG195_20565 [Arthrobacter sp. TES]GLU61119.1 hypothetical protein Pure01_36320 [Paenarthrobacter ureafaciens]GLU65388.1 hypothetical protein Pure02_36380 [Paenarthrobacter ureafaciens]GLU69775.1 hypothetical protein Pure03_37510 [Paenarthrobacter ureafaciens]
MATAFTRHAAAFLRRAGMLTGMLAIIAGIFGMHILSGSHDMPMAAGGSQTAVLHSGHVTGGPLDGQPSTTAVDDGATPVTASSSCLNPAPCPVMGSMSQECVPAPGNTSFDAPLPGTTTLAYRVDTGTDHTAGRLYLAASPSPGDLGISRT